MTDSPGFAAISSAILQLYLKGLWNACNVLVILKALAAKRFEILGTALKAAAVNMLIVVGSELGVLHMLLQPAIRRFGTWVYMPGGTVITSVNYLASIVGLSDQNIFGDDPHQLPTPPEWVPYICMTLFYVFWMIPIWLLIYLAVNIDAYHRVAILAHQQRYGEAKDKGYHGPSNLHTFAEEAYRYLFYTFLLAQTYALQALPNLSWMISDNRSESSSHYLGRGDVVEGEVDLDSEGLSRVHPEGGGEFSISALASQPFVTLQLAKSLARSKIIGSLSWLLHFDQQGRILSLVLTTLLYSLCAFEYTWALRTAPPQSQETVNLPTEPKSNITKPKGDSDDMEGASKAAKKGGASKAQPVVVVGMPVPLRHECIEVGWPYFAGFGTPLAVVTFFAFGGRRPFASLGLYAVLFPLNILLAMDASAPVPLRAFGTSPDASSDAYTCAVICARYIPKLPVFAPSYALVNWFVDAVSRKVHEKQQEHFTVRTAAVPGMAIGKQGITHTTHSLSPPPTSVPSTETSRHHSGSIGETTATGTKLSMPPAHLQGDIQRALIQKQKDEDERREREKTQQEQRSILAALRRKGQRSLLFPNLT